MSINRKIVRTAAAGALIALLGLGGALAQTTPDAQPGPAATTAPAPAAKVAHAKKHRVPTHRRHHAKSATPAKAPATSAAPATKN